MRVASLVVALLVAFAGGASAYGRGMTVQASYGGGQAPVWSPDGRQIAYIGPAPAVLTDPAALGFTHVLVLNGDGSGSPKVVATAPRSQNLAEVRWADGGRFVYEDSNLTLWSSAGGKAKRLGVLGVTGIVGESFSLSADRRQVAFTGPCECNVRGGNDVRFVPASGGAARELPRPKEALDSDPSFSPNGTEVAFSRVLMNEKAWPPFANELIEIAGVHGGAAHWLGVHGATPVISPDGRWVAFVGRAGLEVVAAAGGKARTLLPHRCCNTRTAYSWSPDSQTLAYVSNAGSGTVTVTGKNTAFSTPGLRSDLHTPQWSPDGKTIAFSAARTKDDALPDRIFLIGADGTGLRQIA